MIPQKLQSSLIYQDVFPGIDLQYTNFGYNIKEQIIINEPQESYRFDFLLESSSLTAVLNENSSVSFLNSDQEEIYRIPIHLPDSYWEIMESLTCSFSANSFFSHPLSSRSDIRRSANVCMVSPPFMLSEL